MFLEAVLTLDGMCSVFSLTGKKPQKIAIMDSHSLLSEIQLSAISSVYLKRGLWKESESGTG